MTEDRQTSAPPAEASDLQTRHLRGDVLDVQLLVRRVPGVAGHLEDAQLAFEKMLTYANHLGLYSEQIGSSGELLDNFPQAFTTSRSSAPRSGSTGNSRCNAPPDPNRIRPSARFGMHSRPRARRDAMEHRPMSRPGADVARRYPIVSAADPCPASQSEETACAIARHSSARPTS